MDKQLLNDILSIVKSEKEKHNVEEGDHQELSGIIYELKTSDSSDDSDEELLKSEQIESEQEVTSELSGESEIIDDNLTDKQKKDLKTIQNIQGQMIIGLFENISQYSDSEISSTNLTADLKNLLLYKDNLVLHKILVSTPKYQDVMKNKLNKAAFDIINNSKTAQAFSR
ncbi:MAG: hypothetical protein ISQ32_00550 [Rickettsiales bacterium]|nr:hypothetical protein [Rickettsiales bacterium]